MCGITGVYSFGGHSVQIDESALQLAVASLKKRGPNANGYKIIGSVGLGHTRLSIMDTSSAANQPFVEASGRYVLIFNGEIFNFLSLKDNLISSGETFETTSDTEVLFKLLIHYGERALVMLNGFFAFAFYDRDQDKLLLARDRFGVKPLVYYQNDSIFAFASEMKALLAYNIPKVLDGVSLYQYLQLNYIPGNHSIYQGVEKLAPGTFMVIQPHGSETHAYYSIPNVITREAQDYATSQSQLVHLLDDAVRLRLVADVPLGLFLSGGIDSSVITALASRHNNNLRTFSIGYKDNPYFDETNYAQLVADKFKTQHTVFSLTSDDLLSDLDEMLEYIDEPFADSSALAVYILSKRTRKEVTVALSGDGADELFSGYNKHAAEWNIRHRHVLNLTARIAGPLAYLLPKSRNNPVSNLFRKVERYYEGLRLSPAERYWRWCSLANEKEASQLFAREFSVTDYHQRKAHLLRHFEEDKSINAVLRSDVDMVLPNDMLVKVDMMSMANGLEIRNPFLDYRVVEFAFSLPTEQKINGQMKKRIVQDAFRDILPHELYNRPKHGFEVPLLQWMRNELKSRILEVTNKDFIQSQGIFSPEAVQALLSQLFSNNPGDSPSRVWALFIFQRWHQRFL